jgi:BMFP domain-containing protein YqiC
VQQIAADRRGVPWQPVAHVSPAGCQRAKRTGASDRMHSVCYTHLRETGGQLDTKVIDEISGRVQELIANTPVEDVQKNVRAVMSGWFSRLDLVTREEFDVQQAVLQRTREKLSGMEARVAELEQLVSSRNDG